MHGAHADARMGGSEAVAVSPSSAAPTDGGLGVSATVSVAGAAEKAKVPGDSVPDAEEWAFSGANTSASGRIWYYFWGKKQKVLPRPAFLQYYPPEEATAVGLKPNILSFLGRTETHGGELYVPQAQYASFLDDYLQAYGKGHLLFLAEKYHNQPYRYFAELDFDWTLDMRHVVDIRPRVMEIVSAAITDFYRCDSPPECLVSMRTPYKSVCQGGRKSTQIINLE
ncbi:hypothetical protein FOA52_008246 [Chlamydomonas sp. UWO 241]|nr:hypothetical protein FOA52_008246 [Chlamydomonas sp. UWO 241]